MQSDNYSIIPDLLHISLSILAFHCKKWSFRTSIFLTACSPLALCSFPSSFNLDMEKMLRGTQGWGVCAMIQPCMEGVRNQRAQLSQNIFSLLSHCLGLKIRNTQQNWRDVSFFLLIFSRLHFPLCCECQIQVGK